MHDRFPVIVGPTAGGKSSLAVEVAIALNGRAEIVTADAFQVYKGMDIGTAKPTLEERRGIAHHLIDLVEPSDSFTVHDWLRYAERTIADVRARGNLPIVVGGTHLYIKAFLDGMFEGPPVDAALRERLRAQPLAELRAELERADPAAAQRIHPADARRTARALEVFHQTGTPISDLQQQWDRENHSREDCVLVGLEWPAELINPRINARVKEMLDRGLVDEACALHESKRLGPQAREALGYKQLIAHFEGRCSLDEAIEKIKVETRRFGKNQRTWLKRLRPTPGSVWIDASVITPDRWAPIVLGREPQV